MKFRLALAAFLILGACSAPPKPKPEPVTLPTFADVNEMIARATARMAELNSKFLKDIR